MSWFSIISHDCRNLARFGGSLKIRSHAIIQTKEINTDVYLHNFSSFCEFSLCSSMRAIIVALYDQLLFSTYTDGDNMTLTFSAGFDCINQENVGISTSYYIPYQIILISFIEHWERERERSAVKIFPLEWFVRNVIGIAAESVWPILSPQSISNSHKVNKSKRFKS